MFSERRIVVDIGGKGGRAEKLADLDWFTHFYIIDPQAQPTDHTPRNVHVLSQEVSMNSPLPFETGTVYEAYLDFLMGEVLNPHGSNSSVEEAVGLYRGIVQEIRRVLLPTGRIFVMDVRCNISYAKDVFEQCGFMTTNPIIIQNRNATTHAHEFFQRYLDSGQRANHSSFIPMEFIADVPYSYD